MVSLYRLKGRALQLDCAPIIFLSFFSFLMLVISLGLLPKVYLEFILPLLSYDGFAYSEIINLFSSALLLFLFFSFFFCFRLGIKRYLFKRAKKKRATAKDIFFFFFPRKIFSALIYSLKLSAIRLILLAFCLAPALLCLAFSLSLIKAGASVLVCASLFITAICLCINGVIFYSFFNGSFFLCDYYFTEGAYISFTHLIACSQRNMRKKLSLLTRLKISFSGWFVLCLLLFPVPYVWGYYNQSLAVAAAEFMQ